MHKQVTEHENRNSTRSKTNNKRRINLVYQLAQRQEQRGAVVVATGTLHRLQGELEYMERMRACASESKRTNTNIVH